MVFIQSLITQSIDGSPLMLLRAFLGVFSGDVFEPPLEVESLLHILLKSNYVGTDLFVCFLSVLINHPNNFQKLHVWPYVV